MHQKVTLGNKITEQVKIFRIHNIRPQKVIKLQSCNKMNATINRNVSKSMLSEKKNQL